MARKIKGLIIEFARSREAVTAIEYALIGLLIFIVIVTGVLLTGQNLKPIFNSVSNGF
jgi:Flp pilus assembly pilin Flp